MLPDPYQKIFSRMGNERSSDRLPPNPLGTAPLDTNRPSLLNPSLTPSLNSYDLLKPPAQTPSLSDQLRQLGGQPRLDSPIAPPTDRTVTGDRVIRQPDAKGVLEVMYGEKDFDTLVGQKNYQTLRIKNVPTNVEPKSWVDNKGGFYFWFKNGDDNRAPHYFKDNVQRVVVDYAVGRDGKQYKPMVKPADELRISASQAYLQEQNGIGFASHNNGTDARKYFMRMAGIGEQALSFEEQMLREGAKASPQNPYFRIYLADVLTAQAIKPVIDAAKNGQPIQFDNPQTVAKIDAALAELREARTIAQRFGDVRVPNRDMQLPLSPFGLNPDYLNPDYYWGGAAYQTNQREVSLTFIRGLIKSGLFNNLELP